MFALPRRGLWYNLIMEASLRSIDWNGDSALLEYKTEVILMDCAKTGALIRTLRLEKGVTQKQLADRMNLSDKTISKWERGVSHN